jgi:hypothetical protein
LNGATVALGRATAAGGGWALVRINGLTGTALLEDGEPPEHATKRTLVAMTAKTRLFTTVYILEA